METTPRNSLHLNSKFAVVYSPLISQSEMYSTHSSGSPKSTLERMYSAKQDLNRNTIMPTISEPKKRNMFQTMFNSLTNIFVDQLAKVPASLINNLSNVNSTLSVTIVPNEGIISQEFFKTLTGQKNDLSDNMYIQCTQNKEPQMDFVEAIKFNSKVHIPKDEFLGRANDSKSPTLDDFDMCLDTEPMFLYEKPFDSNEITTNQTLKKEKLELGDSKKNMKDYIVSIDEVISEDKLISPEQLQGPKSSLTELPQEKSPLSSNLFSSTWQKVMNGVLDHVRSFSPESAACTKKYQSTKARRKANCVSSGRGRGRGKSQLRRNGVSQTRHRKERRKHELCSDIQDDLDTWEELEAYTIPLNGLRQNENQNDIMDAESPSDSLSFELINIKPKKTKQRKNILMKSDNFSMKVRYVPECSLEEKEANSTIDKTAFRARLISEASVDSEDSFIVFGTGSESDFDDCNYLDEDETSDSESETESKTDDETLRHKVRFNLNPTVHRMVKWDFAYRAARHGPWEEMARDRERFKDRITSIGRVIEPVLASDLRTKVWKERFANQE